MKNKFKSKVASSVSVIGGADGPSSFFIAERNASKRNFKQNIHKWLYDFRKKQVVKSLKANPHSMDQVADYIMNELGFVEIDKADKEYKSEYYQMRASFILQYKPELLGKLAEVPKFESHNEEDIKVFMAKMEQRQKAAEEIPPDVFDINLHMYEKRDGKFQSKIIIEKNYGYIGGSASGSKKSVKKYNKMFKKVYQYYGVSQRDIDNNTQRYIELINTLALR